MRVDLNRAVVAIVVLALAPSAFGAEPHIVKEKLRARFSEKKITIKGKIVGHGDWPVGLRMELIDGQESVIASASDTMRANGTEAFQIELPSAKGQKFRRDALVSARVRYWLRRGKKEEEAGTVGLAEICPKLGKKRHWW